MADSREHHADGLAADGLAPGLALVGVCVIAAFGLHHLIDSLSPLVAAVALGAVLANVGLLPPAARAGLLFSAKRLLRVGIVLLGFKLSVGEVAHLGARGLGVVIAVVAATFFGTQWVGRLLGVSRPMSLLVATGFSICGASAIAAMEGVSDADENEVAFSIALVTLCGSLAIAVLPLLARPIGLGGEQFGSWAGASVHDVAQVIATAASNGPAAVRSAVIVKLTRVVLLAPLVAGVSLHRRRAAGMSEATIAGSANPLHRNEERPPIMPLFVAGFLTTIAVRSTSLVPNAALTMFDTAEKLLLAAALVGLGSGVRIAKLRIIGPRPLVLGLASWLLVGTAAYLGVKLTGV